MQDDLNKLAAWEKQWKMEFHPDKCEVLSVNRKTTKVYRNYVLHGKTLKSVDNAKYLGITISSDLRWNKHVVNITNKANRTLGFLRRNLRIGSSRLKTSAYNTLMRPSLEYGCTVWDPFTQDNINKIEMIQRRAVRFVLKKYDRYESVSAMLIQTVWISVQTRRKAIRLCMLYKICNNLVDMGYQLMLSPHSSSRHVNVQGYKVPYSITNYHQFSFLPRTIREWITRCSYTGT